MLKENWRLVARVERLADLLIISSAFLLSYYGRGSLIYWNSYFDLGLPFAGDRLAPLREYLVVLLVALVGFSVTLQALGAYGSMRLSSAWRLLKISLLSSLIVFVLVAAALFIVKIDLSRSFLALLFILVALSITVERYVVLALLRFWRRRGKNFRNIIVCGLGAQAKRLVFELVRRPELGINVRLFANLNPNSDPAALATKMHEMLKKLGYEVEVNIINGAEAVEEALNNLAIDEVIFTDVVDVMPQVEELVLLCSERGVRTTIAADLFSIGLVKSGISYFGEMPLVHFQTPPGDRWELSLKRCLDVILAGVLLVLFAPLLALICLAIKLDSNGPIMFVQRRVGLNGRIFNLYKFRSMVPDAEQQLTELRELNEMQGPVFKLKQDPRVTRIGRLLRRWSLDELPQLWNVFRGDMSLVGPRPPVPGEVTLYERRYRRRLSMRPGLTCTWQVSGRSDITDFNAWVKLDLEYIDNWSLKRDLVLLFKTIPAVLFGAGAR